MQNDGKQRKFTCKYFQKVQKKYNFDGVLPYHLLGFSSLAQVFDCN